jgi:hypothetical protein
MSKDIGIFFSDAQLLAYLTPRLNDFIAERVLNYTEMSNFIKLTLVNGEIDFILAPIVTKNPYTSERYGNDVVRVETPEEIIAKKILYKADQLKARDIFDLAAVIYHDKEVMLRNSGIINAKLKALRSRMTMIDRYYHNEIQALDILDDSFIKSSATEIVKEFLAEFSVSYQ